MDEITLIHTGLASKIGKFNFLPFLAAQKFIVHINIQIHATCSILIVRQCFFNPPNNVLYKTQ